MTRDERRREILSAAARLFMERGYDAASVRDLAKAIGVTQPTLYRYIGSKHQLLADIHASMQDDRLNRFRRVAQAGLAPAEQIRALVRESFEQAALRTPEAVVITRERHRLDAAYMGGRTSGYQELDDIVRNVFESGVRAGCWAQSKVFAGRMMMRAIMIDFPRWFEGEGESSFDVLADDFAALIVDALKAPER